MDTLNAIWSNEIYQKIILTVMVFLIQAIVRYILLGFLINRIPDANRHLYTIRKVTTYIISVVGAILIFGIWIQRLGDLSVALGIFAAGLAFALQEVIGSIAGWITIITGRLFTIGDRVETGGIRGDVVDIGVLRTTLMEIGNWLNGDHNTGRIVTVSNAFLFKEPLYNYSVHLRFVWDEIKIPITYESNWKRAIDIMSSAVYEHSAYKELLPKAEKRRRESTRPIINKNDAARTSHLCENYR